MSISRDGDFRASLDSLFQCLTVHVIIFSSCQLIEPPLATTCVLLLLSYHHALLRRVWVCLIYTIPIQLLHVAMQSPLSLFSPGWKNSTPSASPCTSYAAALDYCDDPSLICPCLSCRGETKTGHSTPDTNLKCWIEWKDHFPQPWWCSPGCGSPSSQPGHTICSCSTCCPSLPSQYQASTVAWGYSTPYSGFAFCLVELQETYLSWNFWKAAVSHKTIDSMAEMSQLASILLHPAADITIILWRGGEISGHSPSERK